jgi:hypothetical protein
MQRAEDKCGPPRLHHGDRRGHVAANISWLPRPMYRVMTQDRRSPRKS